VGTGRVMGAAAFASAVRAHAPDREYRPAAVLGVPERGLSRADEPVTVWRHVR
jgi:hypothetical protein